jgi:hypothetical protein
MTSAATWGGGTVGNELTRFTSYGAIPAPPTAMPPRLPRVTHWRWPR